MTGGRTRLYCTQCPDSKLIAIDRDRIDEDPAIRAEAVGMDAEEWRDAPKRSIKTGCETCGYPTRHKPSIGRFGGGFAVPTTHPRANDLWVFGE